jgi:murein DD-endopeptidase MepM/ murein hydrolase activator NlpD
MPQPFEDNKQQDADAEPISGSGQAATRRKTILRVAAAALLFGMGAVAVVAFIKLDSAKPPEVLAEKADAPAVSAAPPQNSRTEVKRFDYSRPPVAQNGRSGGAIADDQPFLLTDNPQSFEFNLEGQLVSIVQNSGPEHIPSAWAHVGRVTNEFGYRRNPFGGASYEFHFGMDIAGDTGDTVVSPARGRILRAQWHGGYGNFIEVTHGNGLTTRYGHLSKISVVVGQPVERGQLIGFIGSTGRSTGPHLHYETRLNGKPFNPRRFLSFGP